ncbi:MAG: hypothetical protein GXY03_04925 [Solirubrobacterales bacterium]|nr:hypothetical protein [Solirubrobacterales bacterium]
MGGEFAWLVAGGLTVFVLILLALGKWYPGTGAEQVDWKPTRSPELEVELELDDVAQMLEANNARRRASGRPELTEDGLREEVAAEEERRLRDYSEPGEDEA